MSDHCYSYRVVCVVGMMVGRLVHTWMCCSCDDRQTCRELCVLWYCVVVTVRGLRVLCCVVVVCCGDGHWTVCVVVVCVVGTVRGLFVLW